MQALQAEGITADVVDKLWRLYDRSSADRGPPVVLAFEELRPAEGMLRALRLYHHAAAAFGPARAGQAFSAVVGRREPARAGVLQEVKPKLFICLDDAHLAFEPLMRAYDSITLLSATCPTVPMISSDFGVSSVHADVTTDTEVAEGLSALIVGPYHEKLVNGGPGERWDSCSGW